MCWYSYGGKEYSTKDFSWIVSNGSSQLIHNNANVSPPCNAIKMAIEHDGNGPYYSIIANTHRGLIPGKACMKWREAWFPYAGKENLTNNFYWIVVNDS